MPPLGDNVPNIQAAKNIILYKIDEERPVPKPNL